MSQVGHIDLRVSDIAAAQTFYEQLLPALGFTDRWESETWKSWGTTEPRPSTAHFAITEKPGHTANSSRIAFWVSSEEEVDRVTEIARRAGAAEPKRPEAYAVWPRLLRVVLCRPIRNLLEVCVEPE